MLQTNILFSDDEIKIRIEQKDGSILYYNLNDLSEINFEDYSFSSFCNIYYKTDSIFSTQTYKILSMTVKKGISNIDSLSVYYYSNIIDKVYLNLPLNVIDSITIVNKNEIYNKIFTNLKIDINGLFAVYRNYVNIRPPGDSKSYNDTVNFNKSINLKNNFQKYWNGYGWGCNKCFSQEIKGDLFYCYSVESYSGTHNTCSFSRCYLFIDTVKMVIDSLFFVSEVKDYEPPQTGGGYRNELDYNESLKLFSIPFSLQNNDIVVNYNLNDFTKIKYNYSSHHAVGTSGNFTDSYKYFNNFFSPNNSANISIIIRE